MGKAENIRNIGLFGHATTGKTTLSEAILFTAKAIGKMGSVENANTVMDFDEEEKERGNSINLAVARFDYKGIAINLIDTPGYANFITDAYAAIPVVDGAIVLTSIVEGVKVQTERLWKEMDNYATPRIIFLNEVDKLTEEPNFEAICKDIKESLDINPTMITLPAFINGKLAGIVDLVELKLHIYNENGKTVEDIPQNLQEKFRTFRERCLENILETNEELMEKYLEGEEIEKWELIETLIKGVKESRIFPILSGSALNRTGIDLLLEYAIKLLPNPTERGFVEGVDPTTGNSIKRRTTMDEPFSALVFKTYSDPFAGKISLIRVFSGRISPDSTVLNTNRDVKEKIGKIAYPFGKEQKPALEAVCGDIIVITKLKDTKTQDTLCDPNSPIRFDIMNLPTPILSCAIRAKGKQDEEKISLALQRMMEEDPSIEVKRDPQTKELIITGLGKLHLESIVNRMKKRFNVEVELQPPKVPYKETIKQTAEAQGRYIKQSGGRGQYGVVWLRLEPLPRGAGFEFTETIVGGVVPRQYIPSVEKGVRKALEEGILAGYPVVDVKVTLFDGKHHPVDSSDLAFQIAASMAFKEAMAKANPVILEPIMKIEITTPNDCVGDVIGDLNSRRGRVLGIEAKGKMQIVRALVPLAEVLEYAPTLRSITGGRGTYSMVLSHYEEVPPHIAKNIIEEAKKNNKKEATG